MYCLIAYATNQVQRFPVGAESLLVGSKPDCDICLPFHGVDGHHARILRGEEGLRIEEVDGQGGIEVNGERVSTAVIEALDEIRLGAVTLVVEPEPENADPDEGPEGDTLFLPVMSPERMTQHLAALSRWVLTDTESRVSLESLTKDLLEDFGGGILFLAQSADASDPMVKFVISTQAEWLAAPATLLEQVREAGGGLNGESSGRSVGKLLGRGSLIYYSFQRVFERSYVALMALPNFRKREWSALPSFQALSDLLIQGLVHHVGRYEPIVPGSGAERDLVLAPGLIVGESQIMRRVMERVRALPGNDTSILFRGEPGSGRELLARTVHLSSPRREAPFVVVRCSGAEPYQLEADLFGAQVEGGARSLPREGKISLANHGTLYIEDPEALPMELQSRLLRTLRAGALETADSSVPIDVRILIGAQASLDQLARRGTFRLDLALRLNQVSVEVPPLRARRDDLPILIQGFINRFCHEANKRVAGITMRTMETLTQYSFPGNLRELENVTRQMVYLCPGGQPVDAQFLPYDVRMASLRVVPEVGEESDLDLERLVESCETIAIQEAMRRSQGNKSQAARLLGISRNGLAQKIRRYNLRSEG